MPAYMGPFCERGARSGYPLGPAGNGSHAARSRCAPAGAGIEAAELAEPVHPEPLAGAGIKAAVRATKPPTSTR